LFESLSDEEQFETALEEISQAIGIHALCDLDEKTWNLYQVTVKDDDRKRRVKHAVTENARTKQAAAALKNGELKTFGELMKASHQSLSEDYEVTGDEMDALAEAACMSGYSAKYYRLSRLLLELTQAKADGTYRKLLQQLAKLDLLILDDWGLEPFEAAQRNDLMEIMDDRHGLSSTIIISQLPTEEWYRAIGDNTLADAILDRLMHNAHRIKLKGESMRKQQPELTEREQLA
jgi:hypothetical protein